MPRFDVVVQYLELEPQNFRPKAVDRTDVSFSHVNIPIPELNRFFYAAIGGKWFWLDRRPWDLQQWTAHLADTARVETWVLAVDGIPAGYVELERQAPGIVEIDYLGVLEPFIGGGLGAHLLTKSCQRAFDMGATRVLVNTCNLDHPGALANYQARGFTVVRSERKPRDIPSTPPGPWDGAV